MIDDNSKVQLAEVVAAIFDMDGVITETATVHAASWKRLFDEYLRERERKHGEQYRAFKIDPDYFMYIDGKPRYDGVKSFLESRGISLPFGDPSDSPDHETICGLGNRKNRYFLERLKAEGAKAFESSVRFVKELKSHGIKTAVISASKNCKDVLEAAGVDDLFEIVVDGIDSERLKLKGKPAPDIFLEAARRLGVKPESAIVLEDALAGVQAGRAGGFKVVIGIDRTGHAKELSEGGADIVVKDLAELRIEADGEKVLKASWKPSAMERKEEIIHKLRSGVPAIFLDYDGTLTPIVADPDAALLPEKTRGLIEGLSKHLAVAVVSGRDLEDVKRKVKVDGIFYAGSHGFEISGPGNFYDQSQGRPFLDSLDKAEEELRDSLKGLKGIRVERKRFAIAVHYRAADEATAAAAGSKVDTAAGHFPKLRKAGGKKIFELRPDADWDKGKAIMAMIKALHLDTSKVVPLYIGDDVTDEDAFRAVSDRGVSILVAQQAQETLAQYILRDTAEVASFLGELAALAARETSRGFWMIAFDDYDPKQERLREALCTTGNGYFATRGAAPEMSAGPYHYPGTYPAGLYNRLKTDIQGETIENESIVNAPNWLPVSFRIEGGEWFSIDSENVQEYRQELDLSRGLLSRFVRFVSPDGKNTRVTQRRFVHMALHHLAALETTITAENWSGRLDVKIGIDGTVDNSGVDRYLDLNHRHLVPVTQGQADDETVYLQVQTNQSRVRVAEAARTRVFRGGELLSVERNTASEPGEVWQSFDLKVEKDEGVTVEKVVSLFTSRDHAISESLMEAIKRAQRADDFPTLLERHVMAWEHVWERCKMTVEGDSQRIAQVLHFHIFHILQTVSMHSIDMDVGVPPRGLHGEAYRGHIMWDEIFILPFLNFRIPDISRGLLLYRYRRMAEARWAALQEGYEGVMFPWQSGSDGTEESQTLHLNPMSGRWIPDNSNLQRHINLAVAYNTWHYYRVTGDLDFLCYYGAELVIEIARFWASKAEYNRSLGRYEIKCVMGPDEFHEGYPDADEPGIHNNAYTNVMTVWVMCRALEIIELFPQDRRKALLEDLGVRREEMQKWDDISRKMRIVFHDDGIISQFEHYDQLLEFDWEGYRKKYGDIQRLDRILESEGDSPNRYKVSKQADVLMLFYLFSADELHELFERLGYPFEYSTIPKNIDYYLNRTSHGSTLSRVVHSWVLARSKREQSWRLFQDALESDIRDIQGGTTSEGIHLGAMAGTVDLIQRCYTGMEVRGEVLRLNPYLPEELSRLEFDIQYRQHLLNLKISKSRLIVTATPCGAAPIKIAYLEKTYELRPGGTLEFVLVRN